jgi:hypothetical protein
LPLFLGQGPEEVDLVLAWGLPLIIAFKRRLQVRLIVHIERLRLQLTVRRVIDASHRASRGQVVQVSSQLGKLGAGGILLALLLLHELFLVMGVEEGAHLFVLSFDVVEVLLAGVEIVLVLARVETAVAARIMDRVETYNFWIILACSSKNLFWCWSLISSALAICSLRPWKPRYMR